MTETTTVRLWFVRESKDARLYSKVPRSRKPDPDTDFVWLPKSLCERITKYPAKEGEVYSEHHLVIPDWLADSRHL